jgi:2-oxo-4-hydroxy-4-carboxy-5-ureidoimidazoline decarboxylase
MTSALARRRARCLPCATRPREIVSMGADLLTQFNELPAAAARAALLACCSSPVWADRMIAGRPFATPQDAISLSGEIVSAMTAADLAAALAGHPQIGARRHPERGPDRSAEWSRQEQALVSTADAQTSRELAEANVEYEREFGHIYLVCASGRTGPELLALLRARLRNDAETEWQVVRSELRQINEVRLQRLLAGSA